MLSLPQVGRQSVCGKYMKYNSTLLILLCPSLITSQLNKEMERTQLIQAQTQSCTAHAEAAHAGDAEAQDALMLLVLM